MSNKYKQLIQLLFASSISLMHVLLMADTHSAQYLQIDHDKITHYDIGQMTSISATENIEVLFYDGTLIKRYSDIINNNFKEGHYFKSQYIVLSNQSSLQNYDYYIGVTDKQQIILKHDKRIKIIRLPSDDHKYIGTSVNINSKNIDFFLRPASESVIIKNDHNNLIFACGNGLILFSLDQSKIIKIIKLHWREIIERYKDITQEKVSVRHMANLIDAPQHTTKSYDYAPHDDGVLTDIMPEKTSIASIDGILFMASIIKYIDASYLTLISLDGTFKHSNIHWFYMIKLNTDIFPEEYDMQTPEIALSTDKVYIIYQLMFIIFDQETGSVLFQKLFHTNEILLKGLVINKDGHAYTQGKRHIYGISSDMKLIAQKYAFCQKGMKYIDHTVTPAEGMIINDKNQLIITYISDPYICIDNISKHPAFTHRLPELSVMTLPIGRNGDIRIAGDIDIKCHTLSYPIDENLASISDEIMVTWSIGPPALLDNGLFTIPLGIFNRKSCDHSAPIFSVMMTQETYKANSVIDKCALWAKKFKDSKNTSHLSTSTYASCKESESQLSDLAFYAALSSPIAVYFIYKAIRFLPQKHTPHEVSKDPYKRYSRKKNFHNRFPEIGSNSQLQSKPICNMMSGISPTATTATTARNENDERDKRSKRITIIKETIQGIIRIKTISRQDLLNFLITISEIYDRDDIREALMSNIAFSNSLKYKCNQLNIDSGYFTGKIKIFKSIFS